MPQKPTESVAEYRRRIFQASAWDEFYADVLLPPFRDPLNRRDIDDSFEPWLDKFIASEVRIGASSNSPGFGVKTALQKTCQLDKTGITTLLYWVLCACYQAATTDLSDRSRRQKDSEFLKECPSQVKALTKIIKFMKRYPDYCSWPLAQAYLTWRGDHPGYGIQVIMGDNKSLPFATICEPLLTNYATALKNGVGARNKGPWLHRVKAGPLLYPDSVPLDRQKAQPDVKVDGLLFHLTFLFRLYTSSNPHGRWQAGQRMPTSGKPHIPLVTLLTNATLGKDLSIEVARSRVQSLAKKGVGLIGW